MCRPPIKICGTVVRPPDPERLRTVFGERASAVDAVTFTSSATVRGLVEGLERAGLDARETLRAPALAAIGPITAGTLREHGLEPAVIAGDYTIPGLVEALVRYYSARELSNEGG